MTDDLERALRARGAVLEGYRGLTMPTHFGDVGREWRAASEGAGVFVADWRSVIVASGEDRVTFLQGMLSNDVKALAAGEGTYAAFLTQQGKVVSDMRVYAEADRLLLDVVAWRRAPLQEGLERFIVADDVELAVAEEEGLLLGLEGPLAAAVAGEALAITELPKTPYSHMRATFESTPLTVIAASEAERSGILFYGQRRIAPTLFEACLEAGGQPLGMQALEVLRVESGIPWAGVDMDDTTLIMETGRTAALSFSKGCYLGQEVVERIAARGHVNRQLAGLVIGGSAVPPPGGQVLAAGREVGYVTSAVQSQALERPIALAMVQRKHAAAGESVSVQTGSGEAAATVSTLPFDAA